MTHTDHQRFVSLDLAEPVWLVNREGVPEQAHLFDDKHVLAIRSALAARRPLLVRGEPGCGKTQLAAAAARVLQRPLVSLVVDARTESTDLMWRFDSVRRLAEAQLCGTLNLKPEQIEERLAIARFVTPGPLWWGFDWEQAALHVAEHKLPVRAADAGTSAANGCVVLIDEIDKADSDVPNGLLEALGSGEFTPDGCAAVRVGKRPPLVIVTTNEERALPDAFVRRCLVLRVQLPAADKLKQHLVDRGRAHFQRVPQVAGIAPLPPLDDKLLEDAATMLISDRSAGVLPLPGLAEYLDLLRAVRELAAEGAGPPEELLDAVRSFTLRKHMGDTV